MRPGTAMERASLKGTPSDASGLPETTLPVAQALPAVNPASLGASAAAGAAVEESCMAVAKRRVNTKALTGLRGLVRSELGCALRSVRARAGTQAGSTQTSLLLPLLCLVPDKAPVIGFLCWSQLPSLIRWQTKTELPASIGARSCPRGRRAPLRTRMATIC